MKTRLATIILGTIPLLSACGTPGMTLSTPQPATPQTFHAPSTILAPTIAGDGPMQMWNIPNDPAVVIERLTTWLSSAQVTTVHLAKSNSHVQFADYLGPAQLYFTTGSGQQIVVAPAYTISHKASGYYVALVSGIVSYRDGKDVTYLNAPSLYQWLAIDRNWQAQFHAESYTPAQQHAITVAKQSKWGGAFTNIFPATPGINHRVVSIGQSKSTKSTGSSGSSGSTLPVTVLSQVQTSGQTNTVTFTEVWDNGRKQHQWTFVVSPKNKVIRHSESGDDLPV